MATTVQDLLTDALVDCGAFAGGMPPPADAINKAFRRLNGMLSQWNRKRYLIYQLQDLSVTATGAQSYTIGPTGQIVINPRPDKLEAAYMLQLNASPGNPVSYPLKIIATMEDYSRISIKKLTTWTKSVFLNPSFPNGLLYPWPVMQAGFELHVIVKQVLSRYATLASPVNLPEEYEEAIYYNMKVRLSGAYRLRTDGSDVALAKDGLNLIRGANAQIQEMHMPAALRTGRGKYNIYSDNN